MTANVIQNAVTPPQLMTMGCTKEIISYRALGNETVCLQSAPHGVQQLVNFNAAAGDVIGVDDILELTQAHANLSDVAQYITSQNVNGGTMLYFDATGHGLQSQPIAFLQGVTTNVAALVADGGIQYIPDAITVTPAFDAAITLRASGLQTVLLAAMHTGIGPQIINGFNPTESDKIELANILNQTLAHADLSDIASYISVTTVNGNTILSVDPTGTGQAGAAFAVLDGVTVTLAQLLADGALIYDPTKTSSFAAPNETFVYRSAGAENAVITAAQHNDPTQLSGFSLAGGDTIDVGHILAAAGITGSLAVVQSDFTTVQHGADTQLWFSATGAGQGGTLAAVFLNTSVTMAQLLAQSAIAWNAGQGVTVSDGITMHMGCTNQTITYIAAGNMGVCLESPQHGVQMLANFNAANGDFIGVDDILETTQAHDDLSDVAQYITSQAVNGGTMLYVDLTGQGLQGTPFAFLEGVTTSVAQLVADGGIKYVPDQVAIAPTVGADFTIRPAGLETVLLNVLTPGVGPQDIYGFAPGAGDNLQLANILGKTLALPNLSDAGQFITATEVGGNTVLSVDPTGHGLAGTPFAVLENTTQTVAQLVAGGALTYDPAWVNVVAPSGGTFAFRSAGAEGALLQNVTGGAAASVLTGFSLANDDGINVRAILAAADLQADLTNIGNYFSTVETGGNTQLWFDPTGSGHGGTLETTFQNTSLTMNDLISHSALHLG
jgi:hypothetical protein